MKVRIRNLGRDVYEVLADCGDFAQVRNLRTGHVTDCQWCLLEVVGS